LHFFHLKEYGMAVIVFVVLKKEHSAERSTLTRANIFHFFAVCVETMTRSSVRGLALISGFLGAAASCFAKFAFEPDLQSVQWIRSSCPVHFLQEASLVIRWNETELSLCSVAELVPRGLFLLAMIACNATMLGTFLEGMQESGSVAGTALSSAANFAASALFGAALFDERFSSQWWLGFSMVVVGSMLLSTVRVTPSTTAASK
jgi:drug/metabolite transporter (DMT)-like permease